MPKPPHAEGGSPVRPAAPGGDYEDAAVPYHPESGDEHAALSAIEQTRRVHEAALMAIGGVAGVATGRTATGDDALVVYLKDASASSKVPRRLDGHPVVCTVTGEIDAQ